MNIKIIIGCIIVLVVVAAGFFLLLKPTQSPTQTEPSPTITTTVIETNETTATEQTVDYSVPNNTENQEYGTDIGMEYPIPDEPLAPSSAE